MTSTVRNDRQLLRMALLILGPLLMMSSIPQTAADDPYWCDVVLGCLNLTSEWTSVLYRPVNPQPFTRDQIGTYFTLHTRSSNVTPGPRIYANSTASIQSSTFNASKPIKVVTHGYTNNGDEGGFVGLTTNLLTLGDYNVIRTHWPGGSQTDYLHAMVNTRVVGLEIALLINTLVANFGVDPTNVHLIGHSLGAHTSGYAGSGIPNCGKITGLDPAGPFFSNMPSVVVLDPTDAQFVEAIHSNTGLANYFGFGSVMPMGHLDFYPNGGQEQPGCDPLSVPPPTWYTIPNWGASLVSCSHGRSTTLYSDSLVSTIPQVAYECADQDTFLSGACNSCGSGNLNCAQFGPSSSSYPSRSRTFVKLYFQTASSSPYGLYHYYIKTSIGGSQTQNGYVNIIITGSSGSTPTTAMLSSPLVPSNQLLASNTNANSLITSATNVGLPTSTSLTYYNCISVLWTNDCKLKVNSVTVSLLNNWPETNRVASTRKTCPSPSPATLDLSYSYSTTASFTTSNC